MLAIIASTLISIYVTGLLSQMVEKKSWLKRNRSRRRRRRGELTVD